MSGTFNVRNVRTKQSARNSTGGRRPPGPPATAAPRIRLVSLPAGRVKLAITTQSGPELAASKLAAAAEAASFMVSEATKVQSTVQLKNAMTFRLVPAAVVSWLAPAADVTAQQPQPQLTQPQPQAAAPAAQQAARAVRFVLMDARELFADACRTRWGDYTGELNAHEIKLVGRDARRNAGQLFAALPLAAECAAMAALLVAGSARGSSLVECLATVEGERLCTALLGFGDAVESDDSSDMQCDDAELEAAAHPLSLSLSSGNSLVLSLWQRIEGTLLPTIMEQLDSASLSFACGVNKFWRRVACDELIWMRVCSPFPLISTLKSQTWCQLSYRELFAQHHASTFAAKSASEYECLQAKAFGPRLEHEYFCATSLKVEYTDSTQLAEAPPICLAAGHSMVWTNCSDDDYATGWHCDRCESHFEKGTFRWCCQACSNDFCFSCKPPPLPSGCVRASKELVSKGNLCQEIKLYEIKSSGLHHRPSQVPQVCLLAGSHAMFPKKSGPAKDHWELVNPHEIAVVLGKGDGRWFQTYVAQLRSMPAANYVTHVTAKQADAVVFLNELLLAQADIIQQHVNNLKIFAASYSCASWHQIFAGFSLDQIQSAAIFVDNVCANVMLRKKDTGARSRPAGICIDEHRLHIPFMPTAQQRSLASYSRSVKEPISDRGHTAVCPLSRTI
eukprot:COSAG06_NODE_570_length_14115_cov_11.866010_16_plen_677_part_00